MYVTKYSASGNDFVLFYTFVKKSRSALAKRLCHRQEGVGADGLIVLVPHETYDFEWQFYNADGSEAAMCGNGSRAAAHYAYSCGLAGRSMRFLTGAGVIEADVDGDVVTSELTPPLVSDRYIKEYGKVWWLINTGVPHLVALVDSIDTFDLKEAKTLRDKYNANVNIAAFKENKLYVRTYERGVENETLACGTGMAASFYRANAEGLVSDGVDVIPSSQETVHLAKKKDTIILRGKVKKTFTALLEKYEV